MFDMQLNTRIFSVSESSVLFVVYTMTKHPEMKKKIKCFTQPASVSETNVSSPADVSH